MKVFGKSLVEIRVGIAARVRITAIIKVRIEIKAISSVGLQLWK